jgi:hypothetical protein
MLAAHDAGKQLDIYGMNPETGNEIITSVNKIVSTPSTSSTGSINLEAFFNSFVASQQPAQNPSASQSPR